MTGSCGAVGACLSGSSFQTCLFLSRSDTKETPRSYKTPRPTVVYFLSTWDRTDQISKT
jgi:hypothetical protein